MKKSQKFDHELSLHSKGRKGGTSPIEEVVDQLLDIYDLKEQLSKQKILQAWEEALGLTVGQRTLKLFIKNQTLFVKLDSASLKQELLMNRSQILKKLNEVADQEVLKEMIFI